MRKFTYVRAGWLVQRADLELAIGNGEDAAVMLGAVRAMEEGGFVLDWVHLGRRARVLDAVTEALGEEAAEASMERGAALDTDELIDLITRPV